MADDNKGMTTETHEISEQKKEKSIIGWTTNNKDVCEKIKSYHKKVV